MKRLLLMCGVLLAIFIPVVAFGAEEEYVEEPIVIFTYNEALALALEDIPALQELENRIEELEEELYYFNRDFRNLRWQLSETAINELRRQQTELEREIEHLSLDAIIIRLRREQSLRNNLVANANAAIDIEIAEAALVLTEEQLRRTGLLHRFGFASASELRIAQQRLTQEQMSLDNLQVAQTNALSNLNHLLGQPSHQQTYVEFERELPEIPENLISHIPALVAQAPTIRQMQFNVYRRQEERERHLRIYRDRGERPRRDCEICEALQFAYDIVSLEQSTAMRAMETALRTAHSNLEQMHTQEAAARLRLTQAEESLQTAETNLDLGRVTQFDVDMALYAIFNAEQAIERILNLQWGMVLLLGNPVLL